MAIKPKHFRPSVSAETQFARALKKVGRHAGHIVETHVDGVIIHDKPGMEEALKAYSKLIDPWARRQAAKMLEKVSKSNHTSFQRAANLRASEKNSKEIGKLLKETVAKKDVGQVAAKLMQEQVALIKSIPLDAGIRAQKLSLEAAYDGSRASQVAKELARSGEVSESKAELIARTEVARANASINQARASAVGSRQYKWRNSGDEAVRHAHKMFKGKRIEGMVFSWDSPPTLDDGTVGHPGTFPNCRCYAEPIFADDV